MPVPPTKILIVEDDFFALRLLKMIMERAGYTVESAMNGAEGLRLFKSGSWSLVITDRRMPEMDGDEMAAAIRKTDSTVPIILVTGAGGGVNPEPAVFYAVLPKPFVLDVLLKTVAEALERRRVF